MMKILRNSLIIVALFSLTLFLSSFDSSNNGNGNIVTVDNGQTWWWAPDNCATAWIASSSARVQSATNGFFSLTVTFQLPEGHCDIPERGAVVTHYDANSWSIVNSKGKVKGKIIFRPNN